MIESEAGVKKYIYDWLVGLNIGPVLQDRKPFDDTTKLRNLRTYIVYDFPDGIEDAGPWYYGQCVVCIGCRDKERFVADLTVLDGACAKLKKCFDINDDANSVSLIGLEFVDDYSDGVGNHECRYVFDVYANKQVEI